MSRDDYYNPDYHVFRKENNPNRLFASFSVYKQIKSINWWAYDDRPPYPILNSKPSVHEVISNINRSDVLLYAAHLALGTNINYFNLIFLYLLISTYFNLRWY